MGVCTELDTAVGAWTEEGAGKGGVRGGCQHITVRTKQRRREESWSLGS